MNEPGEKNVCDEKVFNEIFLKNSKDLFQFLYYKYGPENNPHDLVQEAFVKLWNNCRKVIPEKARSFLFTVANNQVLNELSRKKTALKHSGDFKIDHTNEDPEFLMQENEYRKRLQKAIDSLTDEQRVAFLLNRVEGKKHKEIAEMLGISRKAVEKRIYKAINHLRKKVGEIK